MRIRVLLLLAGVGLAACGDDDEPSAPEVPSQVTVQASGTGNQFIPQTAAVSRGGTVTWQFGAITHNVTFTGGQPTGGNVPNTTNTTAQRVFPNAGSFPYNCTIHPGMTGTITVQ